MKKVLLFVLSCQLLQQNFAQECVCIPGSICPEGTFGGIDPRIVNPENTCSTGYVYCCEEDNPIPCGVLKVPPSPHQPGVAAYGAYPWMVAILTNNGGYVGGGVLISSTRVLTVAHKVAKYNAGQIIARLGARDFANDEEPYEDIGISRIRLHPDFIKQNLHNDIAVLNLRSAAPLDYPNVNTACLPSQSVSAGRCWVTGWGEDTFGDGNLQSTLKEVDVSVISQAKCQAALRQTRLGRQFVLHNSFMCAGGGKDKDACTGDGGSPLVCSIDGQYAVFGLVTWGIGCGDTGVPGVYTNVAHFYSWIRE